VSECGLTDGCDVQADLSAEKLEAFGSPILQSLRNKGHSVKELKDAGVLNSGEFEEQKKAVLNAVPQGQPVTQPVPVAPQQVQVGIPGQFAQAPGMQLEMMKMEAAAAERQREREAEAKREQKEADAKRDQKEADAKRDHELKMAQMKLEADKTDQRHDDKLQAERLNNQTMLAQTAQTAASKQAPIINNASQQGGTVGGAVGGVGGASSAASGGGGGDGGGGGGNVPVAPQVVVNIQQDSYHQDPGCCMKCCCPPCAVVTTYGLPDALCTLHLWLSCSLCCLYTVTVWAPSTEKRTGGAVANEEMER